MEDPKNIYVIDDSISGGKFIAGHTYDGIPLTEEYVLRISLDEDFAKDSFLIDNVEHVGNLIKQGKTVFVYGQGKRIYIFCFCFLRRWNRLSPKETMNTITQLYLRKTGETLSFSLEEQNQIKRLKVPKTVVFIADRECNREYDKIIPFEITKLPPYSTIIYLKNGGRLDRRIKELIGDVNNCYMTEASDLDSISKEYEIDMVFLFFYEIRFSPREIKEFINGNVGKYIFYLFDTKSKEHIRDRNDF